MSVSSNLFKKLAGSGMLRSVVEYLETVDLPGAKKKAMATAVVKALHVSGPWDSVLENLVSGAIEYVLADVRHFAQKYDSDHYGYPTPGGTPPPTPPVDPMAGKYDSWHAGDLPSDQVLRDMGFKVGEGKYTTDIDGVDHWTVAHAGGAHNGSYAGAISG